ncbi:MAG: hypothetical protein QGH42_09850 [Kiritimatiellia bacterium]|jgi:hypothetical protein|nr:hypothetical protein [Kiritimatiellia bacterium]MDP6810453.1 hypothetical protein [Kiritimatiellia bacterium]MDP7024526.1 hypothetical protein [Kiritimatiellia bacterium]
MSIQHTSRTGKTYYLHTGVTKTGKPKYFFSTKLDGELADTIPDGFEIYENVNGQVFLRRIPKQIILPDELALVETVLKAHGEDWEYQAEVKKDTITVYECGTDIGRISELIKAYAGRSWTDEEKRQHAHYMAVMRFVLEDKMNRLFTTERFCFKGSIDDWIYVGGPAELSDQVGKHIKHLGQDSFYELY